MSGVTEGSTPCGGDTNLGFEEEPKRKVSIISNDVERKISNISAPKSILVNGDNFTHHTHGTYMVYE